MTMLLSYTSEVLVMNNSAKKIGMKIGQELKCIQAGTNTARFKHPPVRELKRSPSCPTLHEVGKYVSMLTLPLI